MYSKKIVLQCKPQPKPYERPPNEQCGIWTVIEMVFRFLVDCYKYTIKCEKKNIDGEKPTAMLFTRVNHGQDEVFAQNLIFKPSTQESILNCNHCNH